MLTLLCVYAEIKNEADLLGPGATPGTIPTDIEQATGLERLEILGKMQGIDIFDMKPLDASRLGTETTDASRAHTTPIYADHKSRVVFLGRCAVANGEIMQARSIILSLLSLSVMSNMPAVQGFPPIPTSRSGSRYVAFSSPRLHRAPSISFHSISSHFISFPRERFF